MPRSAFISIYTYPHTKQIVEKPPKPPSSTRPLHYPRNMKNPTRGLGRFLWNIAGPERTERNNRFLAAGLALEAGMVNSVGFLAVQIYTSHMTGLTATLADQLVLGDYVIAGIAALGIVCFICGAATSTIIVEWATRRHMKSRYALVFVAEALTTLLVGLLAQEFTDHQLFWPIVAVLCWTMGIQNAIMTGITHGLIRTTHVTGMVTDFAMELGRLVYRNRPDDPDPVRADKYRIKLHLTIWGCFFVGGVIGAALSLWIGFYTVMPAAALLLILALVPVWTDLRLWHSDHHAFDLRAR